MPNIIQLRREATEVKAEAAQALVDVQSGKITQAEFTQKMLGNGGLVAKDKEISDGLKAYGAAAKFDGMPGEYGTLLGQPPSLPPGQSQRPGLARDSGRRLTFGQKSASDLATKIMGDGSLGTKALAPSGSAVVDQDFRPDPISLGKPAYSLLDVLPVQAHDTGEFAYMRQSVRTNNAAVVAEGAVKPTSVYSVVRVEESLVVIAHLSEGVPRYWFLDTAALQGFLNNELDYGLRMAVEAKVVADINATSGTQAQAFATSPLATLRKSLTKLEISGYEAGFFLLHPTDWEGIELALASTNAVDYQGIPYDAASRRLFGVPVVVGVSEAVGVSHTVAKGAVALDTDHTGTGVQWSETSNSDDFSKNLIRARCEGRFATSVYAPLGVVVGDLTA
jgi:HK97 family phage major capsid protein